MGCRELVQELVLGTQRAVVHDDHLEPLVVLLEHGADRVLDEALEPEVGDHHRDERRLRPLRPALAQGRAIAAGLHGAGVLGAEGLRVREPRVDALRPARGDQLVDLGRAASSSSTAVERATSLQSSVSQPASGDAQHLDHPSGGRPEHGPVGGERFEDDAGPAFPTRRADDDVALGQKLRELVAGDRVEEPEAIVALDGHRELVAQRQPERGRVRVAADERER